MLRPKISVITATFNSAETIGHCVDSVNAQTHPNVEHVIVDGVSADRTLDIIGRRGFDNIVIDSRGDSGIYDALNRAIGMVTGDVVGFLHSDDYFPNNKVLVEVANAFNNPAVDMCYGDLAYVAKSDPSRVLRRWRAGEFSLFKLSMGWMPPHPTFYVRREVMVRYLFNLHYQISADYDAMLRMLTDEKLEVVYLRKELVHRRVGGASNKNLRNLLLKTGEDLQIIRDQNIGGLITLLLKNLRKIPQFLFTERIE